MSFVKWSKIENSYQKGNLKFWIELYPELVDEMYIITEKLDGSNFQWHITPDGVRAGSRQRYLGMDSNFQGASVRELSERHFSILDRFKVMAALESCEYRLYGELVGPGIQGRVKYGDEKRILYFGISRDGVLLPRDANEYSFLVQHLAPLVGYAHRLEAALACDIEFNSLVLGVKNNLCEGVVIQPYKKVYISHLGNCFLLKKKNELFAERKKVRSEVSGAVNILHLEFLSLLVRNRVLSVFSKHEPISNIREMGKYIKLIIADAREDFEDLHDMSGILVDEKKFIFNGGRVVAKLLKEYLSESL